jgi:hypothetical protein
MAQAVFPNVKPSSRSFSPGEFPQTVFEAQNGAKSFIRYGNKRVNATLSLGFSNISDEKAAEIITNYVSVAGDPDKYIYFGRANGTAGLDVTLGTSNQLEDYIKGYDDSQYWLNPEDGSSGGLRWRYSGPPKVTSVQPGISNVSCSFVGCLDGD